jgi:aldehyde:ferredoxin oxidoreductase
MYGWTNRILRVNLTTGDISHEKQDSKVARDYIEKGT